MAAAAAAGARDAIRLESLVCFFLFKYFIFCFTNVYFRSTLCIEMAMAAPAQQQETLETRQGMGLGIKGGSKCVASRALGEFFSVISYYYINMVVYVYILLQYFTLPHTVCRIPPDSSGLIWTHLDSTYVTHRHMCSPPDSAGLR